jgi:drug/metabolite transporter (DMT)-like permease
MREHPQFNAYLALAAVCIFWGTTYLGIRIALQDIPPLTLVAARFLLSGGLMVIGAKLSGAILPRGRELWETAGFGLLTLAIGNSCLSFAELLVPSGIAALMVTTAPFWMVGLGALLPGGERLHLPTMLAMLVGCVGVALLAIPLLGHPEQGAIGIIPGFFLLQLSCAAWCLGALLQRRQASRAHPFVSGAVQQLVTGLALVVPAWIDPHQAHWTPRAVGAVVYLAMFGSVVGYSAYLYAIQHLPLAISSIYTYINPLVAVVLGWIVFREPFGKWESASVVVIFLGVYLVKKAQQRSDAEVLVAVEELRADGAAESGQRSQK